MSDYSYSDRSRQMIRASHWQDWANLVLGIWLFFSPWILGFAMTNGAGGAAGASNASWNAWIFGIVIFVVAAFAIVRLQLWEEWVNTIIGLWVFISPWALGFVPVTNAAWDHWIVGALVTICAVWDLQSLRAAPMRRTLGQH